MRPTTYCPKCETLRTFDIESVLAPVPDTPKPSIVVVAVLPCLHRKTLVTPAGPLAIPTDQEEAA